MTQEVSPCPLGTGKIFPLIFFVIQGKFFGFSFALINYALPDLSMRIEIDNTQFCSIYDSTMPSIKFNRGVLSTTIIISSERGEGIPGRISMYPVLGVRLFASLPNLVGLLKLQIC